jgi:hypothetical protein
VTAVLAYLCSVSNSGRILAYFDQEMCSEHKFSLF